MTLPIQPPLEPMECRQLEKIPEGDEWQYEPKWDGFRCIAFRDGDDVYLQSKAGQPLARYFPEVVAALLSLKPRHFVLDGELVIPHGDRLDFDALLQRIHPAQSRITKLSKETPAHYVLFDLLVNERGKDLTGTPLRERREQLEAFVEKHIHRDDVSLSPATQKRTAVDRWYEATGNALDGVVAKRLDREYASGERDAAVKIKHLRTADCVVGGYRLNKTKNGIGSLLLGLYDKAGLLHHVGFTSGFTTKERADVLRKVQPHEKPPGFTGAAPGGPSRWRDTEEPWFPLAPEFVVEVRYDHVTAQRFRHGTKLVRWRPEKAPRQCTMDQIAIDEAATLLDV